MHDNDLVYGFQKGIEKYIYFSKYNIATGNHSKESFNVFSSENLTLCAAIKSSSLTCMKPPEDGQILSVQD